MPLIKAPQLKKGLTPLVTVEDFKEAEMSFSILLLDEGETNTIEQEGETVLLLIKGEALATCNNQEYAMKRNSCFFDEPVSLQCSNNSIQVVSKKNGTQFVVMNTENNNIIEPVFYDAQACKSELRGEGTLNECSTRIVRNILSREHCPDTNFVLGEVVNFPGKWSSYPPHSHPHPEIYYYQFLPDENGYGLSQEGEQAHVVHQGDALLALNGDIHPQVSAPGYAMFYVWVIRDWEQQPYKLPLPVSEHAWTVREGATFFPDRKEE